MDMTTNWMHSKNETGRSQIAIQTAVYPFVQTAVLVDDELVQQIWQECGKQVSRTQIRKLAVAVAAEFQDATVTAFVPIFIRRRIREELADVLFSVQT